MGTTGTSGPGREVQPRSHRGRARSRIGSELLFPVYDLTRANGADFEYRVIGFVGFLLTGFDGQGTAALQGSFTRVVWEGLTSESAEPFFGATVVKLVD